MEGGSGQLSELLTYVHWTIIPIVILVSFHDYLVPHNHIILRLCFWSCQMALTFLVIQPLN